MRWFPLSILVVSLSFLIASAGAWPVHALPVDDEGIVYFEKHIRPLLAQQCHSCHGTQKQKGGLRLDQPEWINKGGDSGKVIVPGSPEKSLIYQALTYQNDELKMPPRGKLSAEQLEHVRKWIDRGAAMPAGTASKAIVAPFDLKERAKHWCYQPLQNVVVPIASNVSQVITPVDAFIQQCWKHQGLKPAAMVSKAVWLRRATYDLTGLPPSADEIVAFEADGSPQAYEAVVDRLLGKTEYGERWARHWLDLMRYADTMGHEFDFDLPNAWRYRNYVIRAINDDVSYQQFVKEHLAGDLLAKPRMNQNERWNESIQATGFLWLGEAKQAPVDVRQEQADRIDNQIDVIGKAFLGQTIACARCHDHKFDAIATRDYYALYGVLKSSHYQQVDINDPRRSQDAVKTLELVHRDIDRRLLNNLPNIHSSVSKAEKHSEYELGTCRNDGLAWQRTNGHTVALYHDPKTKEWKVRYVPAFVWDSGILSEAQEGSLHTDTFTLDQRYLHVEAAGWGGRIRVVVDGFSVIRDPIYGALRRVVNDPKPQWHTFDLKMWQGRQAYVEFIDGGPPDPSVESEHTSGTWMQVRRLTTSQESKPPEPMIAPDVEKTLLNVFKPQEPEWQELLARLNTTEKELPAPRYTLATAEGTGDDERVFIRGNHRLPGEVTPRGLSPLFCGTAPLKVETGSGRLDLAERLCDPKSNPLLARVIVNRVWKHHFGEGLVRSVDDFGRMGETPSHPELLDYLANWFIKEGWSLKKLHRLLVLSYTYRLASSNSDETTYKLDPQLRWLSHMPLRRLEAEAIRDAMLAICGQLKHKTVEEGVMPYLTPVMQGRGRPGVSGSLDGGKYRSIYQSVRRNFLPPLMTSFDFPTPFTAIGKRSLSNTPSQGLTMMNDPLVKQLAKHWADMAIQQHPDKAGRLDSMYVAAFARKPSDDEKRAALQFVAQINSNENKAWAELAHALFCSKEFLFIP